MFSRSKSNPEQTTDYTAVYWFVGILLGAILVSSFLYAFLRSTVRKNHTNPSWIQTINKMIF
jgi:tellurite resistance protein TehA-like permease